METSSKKYISVVKSEQKKLVVGGGGKSQWEIRGDGDQPDGNPSSNESSLSSSSLDLSGWKIKCQREFILKARFAASGEDGKKRKLGSDGRRIDVEGTADDEKERTKKFQTWGMGKSVVAEGDRRELKVAKKEGRLGEAMLDRRSKLKQ